MLQSAVRFLTSPDVDGVTHSFPASLRAAHEGFDHQTAGRLPSAIRHLSDAIAAFPPDLTSAGHPLAPQLHLMRAETLLALVAIPPQNQEPRPGPGVDLGTGRRFSSRKKQIQGLARWDAEQAVRLTKIAIATATSPFGGSEMRESEVGRRARAFLASLPPDSHVSESGESGTVDRNRGRRRDVQRGPVWCHERLVEAAYDPHCGRGLVYQHHDDDDDDGDDEFLLAVERPLVVALARGDREAACHGCAARLPVTGYYVACPYCRIHRFCSPGCGGRDGGGEGKRDEHHPSRVGRIPSTALEVSICGPLHVTTGPWSLLLPPAAVLAVQLGVSDHPSVPPLAYSLSTLAADVDLYAEIVAYALILAHVGPRPTVFTDDYERQLPRPSDESTPRPRPGARVGGGGGEEEGEEGEESFGDTVETAIYTSKLAAYLRLMSAVIANAVAIPALSTNPNLNPNLSTNHHESKLEGGTCDAGTEDHPMGWVDRRRGGLAYFPFLSLANHSCVPTADIRLRRSACGGRGRGRHSYSTSISDGHHCHSGIDRTRQTSRAGDGDDDEEEESIRAYLTLRPTPRSNPEPSFSPSSLATKMITICYSPTTLDGPEHTQQRRSLLQTQYGFLCQCPVCTRHHAGG